MSSTLSIGGLATGLDTQSIVSQLMALERQPETTLTNEKNTMQQQVDVFNQLNTSLGNLQTTMAGMNTAATFEAKTAGVGDSSVMTAQASSTAMAGTHTIVVNSLATYQRQVSAIGYASLDDNNFNTGTIKISGGAKPVTVTIGEGQNSLSGIAAAINNSGANLSAMIINDGSGSPYRLLVTGKDTTNYTIDTSGLATPPAAPNGAAYANLTFPQSGPTYLAGANASFSVDGVDMTKNSNTITDAIPGVTLNLQKDGGATTTVTIGNDNAAVTSKIQSFINGYNSAMGILNAQSTYNSTTKTAGVLSGDFTLMNIQSRLQGIISSPVAGVKGPYTVLSQLGISTNKDGTLSLDGTKLSTALNANFDAVADLFTHNSGIPSLGGNQYGVAEQLNQVLQQMTNIYEGPDSTGNGIIATRINGLQTRMSSIDDQIANMEELISQKEDTLNKQFAAMETMVSSLQTNGNSLLSALSGMTTSTSG